MLEQQRFRDQYEDKAGTYCHRDYQGSYRLIWNAVSDYLYAHTLVDSSKKLIDIGCGTGSSTRLFRSFGFTDCVGIDPSPNMLAKAQELDPNGRYDLMHDAALDPELYQQFDIAISSFVIPTLSSETMVFDHLEDIRAVVKPNGRAIIITVANAAFNPQHSWISWTQEFPENHSIRNGCAVRVHLKDTGLVLEDYAWTKEFLSRAILANRFAIDDILEPLGEGLEESWQSESAVSPFEIYWLSPSPNELCSRERVLKQL